MFNDYDSITHTRVVANLRYPALPPVAERHASVNKPHSER